MHIEADVCLIQLENAMIYMGTMTEDESTINRHGRYFKKKIS
jgi:hypothetical protein